MYKLERLNLNAQTSIILAQEAQADYMATVRQMSNNMERTEQDMLDRAVKLRSSSEAVFSKVSRQPRATETNDQHCGAEKWTNLDEDDDVFH